MNNYNGNDNFNNNYNGSNNFNNNYNGYNGNNYQNSNYNSDNYINEMKENIARANSKNLFKTYTLVGLGLCIFFVVMLFSQTVMSFVAAMVSPDMINEGWFYLFLSDVPLYGVSIWALMFFMSKVKGEKPKKQKFGFANSLSSFFIACFFMLVGAIIGNLVDQIMQAIFQVKIDDSLTAVSNSMSLPVQILFFVVIAPFGEELIFRKFILDRTAKYGEGAAIMFSGITFALFHANFNQLFYAFGAGLLLAYIYVKTGSYIRCVLLHATVNAIFGVIVPYFYSLYEDNNMIIYALSGAECILAIIGMILFIIYLAMKKVKIRKSEYLLSKKAAACAFSNAPFIVFVSVLGLFVFANYMQ